MLASGTAAAQALNIALLPLLARLFAPEEFAALTLYAALVAIIGSIATGRYEYAVLIEVETADAVAAVWSARLFTLASLLVSVPLLLALHPWMALDAATLAMIATGIVLTGWLQVQTAWLDRHARFRRVAAARMAGTLAAGFVMVGGGLAGWGGTALVAGSLTGVAVNLLSGAGAEQARRPAHLLAAIVRVARRHWQYPVYLIPAGLIERTATQLPVLLFSRSFGPAAVGAWGICQRTLGLPAAVMGSAVGEVFRRRFARAMNSARSQSGVDGHETSMLQVLGETILLLAAFAAVPLLVLQMFGEALFVWLFGPQWSLAGQLAQVLAWSIALGFVVSPVSTALHLLGRQRIDLWLQCALLVAVVVALLAGIRSGSILQAAWGLVAAYGAKYLLELCMVFVCTWTRMHRSEGNDER